MVLFRNTMTIFIIRRFIYKLWYKSLWTWQRGLFYNMKGSFSDTKAGGKDECEVIYESFRTYDGEVCLKIMARDDKDFSIESAK